MQATIVVGVDGSEQSQRALAWCAGHAKALDAEVVVVHAIVMPVYAGIGLGAAYMPVSAVLEPDRDELREHVRREWCGPLAAAGVPFRVVCTEGTPASIITEVAQHENAEMVVTGRRGRGGFAELVLGSTSHELAHVLDRPLVIVP